MEIEYKELRFNIDIDWFKPESGSDPACIEWTFTEKTPNFIVKAVERNLDWDEEITNLIFKQLNENTKVIVSD